MPKKTGGNITIKKNFLEVELITAAAKKFKHQAVQKTRQFNQSKMDIKNFILIEACFAFNTK